MRFASVDKKSERIVLFGVFAKKIYGSVPFDVIRDIRAADIRILAFL